MSNNPASNMRMPSNAEIRSMVDEFLKRPENLGMTLKQARKAFFQDPVTGLGNESRWNADVNMGKTSGRQVFAADAAGLTGFNNQFGHDAGNALLKAIGNRIQSAGIQGYRLHGDEFAGIMPQGSPAQNQQVIANLVKDIQSMVVQLPGGKRVTGAGLDASMGSTYKEADTVAQQIKSARKVSVAGNYPAGTDPRLMTDVREVERARQRGLGAFGKANWNKETPVADSSFDAAAAQVDANIAAAQSAGGGGSGGGRKPPTTATPDSDDAESKRKRDEAKRLRREARKIRADAELKKAQEFNNKAKAYAGMDDEEGMLVGNVPPGATSMGGPLGSRKKGGKTEAQLLEEERIASAKAQSEFERMGYPSVYRELAKKDPAYLEPGAVTGLKIQSRNNVRMFDVTRKDEEGNKVQTRVMTDMGGNILPEMTRRTADFTTAIKQNAVEFLKWTIAVGLIYTPILKLQELMQTAIKNQSELTDVMVTMNAAQSDTNKIFESAAQVANATGLSITGVLQGYNQAYRATGDISDITERYAKANIILKDSITLAKLAEIDQASATDILVASLRQTNTPLDHGVTLLDKWVAVSKVANVDVNTLATSFAIVAEAADNAGLSIDELNGLIATVAASGITSAKETGNAVRAIITGVTNNDAVKQLEKFGITVQNSEGQARTFKQIMDDIRAEVATGAISPDQLNTLARAIGGGNRRQAQVVTAIVGQETATTAERASAAASGQAAKALSMELSTVESATIRLGNAFQSLAQVLGTDGGLLDIVTSLTNGSSKTIEALTNVSKLLGTAMPVLLMNIVGRGLGGGEVLGRAATWGANQFTGAVTSRYSTAEAQRLNASTGIDTSLAYRQLQAEQLQRNRPFAQGVGNFARSWAPGALTAGAFAYSNIAQGQTGAGLAAGGTAIAGEFIAKAMGAAPGIGAAIGGSIAEIFIAAWNRSIIEARNTPYNPKPEAGGGAGLTYAQELANLTPEQKLGLFGQTGGAPVGVNDVQRLAQLGKTAQETTMGIPGILSQFGLAQKPNQYETAINQAMLQDPEMQKLLQGTMNYGGSNKLNPDQEKQVEAIRERVRKQLEQFMNPEFSAAGGSQFNLFSQMKEGVGNTDLIKQIQDQARKDLKSRMQPYAENPLTVKQYTTAMGDVEGYQGKLQTLVAAGQLSGSVTDTTKALQDFATLLSKGATESVSEILTLAGDIGDLSSLIEAAQKGKLETVKYGGEDIPIAKARELLTSRKETYNQATGNEQTNIQLRTPIRDIVSMVELTKQQFKLVQDAAIQMYQDDLNSLTDVEKAAALARDANLKYLVKTKDDYESQTKLPSSYLNAAQQDLTNKGKLNLSTAGFSEDKNLTMAQYKLAQQMYPGRLAQVQGIAAAGGGEYKEQKTQSVVMAKDGMMWLDTDMRIFQSLLSEISENTKKMVDGMYNLPEGASFWVPYSAVNSYYNKSTGLATTPDKGTTGDENKDLRDDNTVPSTVSSMIDFYRQHFPASPVPVQQPFMTAGGPDFGTRARAGLSYATISGWMDAGAGVSGVKSMSEAIDNKVPEVSTKLNLNIVANFQVLLDKFVLGKALKTVLVDDLLKYGNNATSVTRTVVI